MTFKHGIAVDLCMAHTMLISMTLTLMQGDGEMAEEINQR